MRARAVELHLGAVGAALIALAFVFAWQGIPEWIPAGVMVSAGLPSPLSGMTRSFVALASGDPVAAFTWHPLGPVVFVGCLAALLLGVRVAVTGRPVEGFRVALTNRRTWIITAAVVLAAWIRQIIVLG